MAVIKNANADLQVHPFLFLGNELQDCLDTMKKRSLDIIALGELNNNIYPKMLYQSGNPSNHLEFDGAGIRIIGNNSRQYILRFTEYDTKEGFQLLTIGYHYGKATPKTEIREIIDAGLENGSLIGLDHPFADNGKTKTAGHISDKKAQELENLCEEYNGQVFLEWNGYSNLFLRAGLKFLLNLYGRGIKYHNINKPVEELSQKLLECRNVNVPVVADSDTHGRNKTYLGDMGSSRIVLDVYGESPRDILNSIKHKIFSREYENVKKYVKASHVAAAYGLPLIMNGKRPRS